MAVAAATATGAAEADSAARTYPELVTGYVTAIENLSSSISNPALRGIFARRVAPYQSDDGLVLFDARGLAKETVTRPGDTVFEELQAIEHRFADELYALATAAVEAGRLAEGLRLATEALRANPDHADARRALGYTLHDGVWRTEFEQRMHEQGKTWHPKYGWLASGDVAEYEAGRRRLGRRWISTDDDARRHASIQRGWQIATEHYRVTTNHSLEAGVSMATRLETLHGLWLQLFADYAYTPRDVAARFQTGDFPRGSSRLMQISYFATRDEYNTTLTADETQIAMTLGIYFDKKRRAYFFAGEEQHQATVFHEGVHQLFSETRRTSRRVGELDNFWIIEGIATYFESLEACDGYYRLGGSSAGRLPAARQRLLVDDYYVPLAELVGLGKRDLQQRPDLSPLYSQLAGLTSFLVHGRDGTYRDVLPAYLRAVYTDQVDLHTLAELTGRSSAELDEEYRQYLQSLPD